MSADTRTPESVRQAFAEMQRYLADEIAPLMAAEAAEVIVALPAKVGAEIIWRWLETQLTAPDRVTSVSGYVYHAVKKFHQLGEVGVVDPRKMDRYVSELSRVVVRLVPEREQTELRLKLSRIAEVRTTLAAPVSLLNREAQDDDAEAMPGDLPERRQEASTPPRVVSPRLKMLLGRLDDLRASMATGKADADVRASLARLVAKAAVESGDAEQLRSMLAGIRGAGVDSKLDRTLFRMLGEQIPDWSLPEGADLSTPAGVGQLLQAMHELVAKSGSREEGIDRFGEMVYAAIDQLNEGHLAQAVAMLDVAQRLIDEKKIDAELAKIVKNRSQASVALAPLRQFAAAPAKHGLLRKVLAFFPAFSPQELLSRLDGEPKRETRKLLLSLVEAHGAPCRPILLERLKGYLDETLPDPAGYYARNAIFLLRRIPRPSGADPAPEFDLLREFSHPDRPFLVAREAIGALAATGFPQAEPVLIQRLGDFERLALQPSGLYTFEETTVILDRTCAALVAFGSIDAIRTVANHANRQDARLGDHNARLRHLSGADLTKDPDLLQVLLETLRASLPARVLGVVLRARAHETECLVEALSGTPDPRVLALFEEIVARYPNQPFAESALRALQKSRSAPAREPSSHDAIAGDLELFGLPALLQSLADASQTGRLWITASNGHTRATMVLREGKIATCEMGPLRGLDAVAQLIERPKPGTFRFERVAPTELPPRGLGMDVLSTLLEAIRRHDEFQEDRALVPEGATLMPGDVQASLPEGESDGDFAKAVWREAARGTAPESCEEVVGSDAYRVRRLYAHWLETGALKRRPAA